jgi:dTDP-4-amino-4,6-dideoxygalactose transaminase
MINVTRVQLPDLNEYYNYLKKIWENNWVTNDGQFLQQFEEKLSDYLKVKNILAVTNGTLALQLVFKALDLEGEVITTPFTFVATTNALIWEGLTPVFADINPETFNLDPVQVENMITPRTSAILAVHVYGNACNTDELQRIADKHGIKLIYDAAHAFGADYQNRSLVSYGDAATLSFHATKVFNTIEGGAIVIKDEEIFEKLKLLRNFGIKTEEEVVCPGINAKMNEFCASMGLCNFTHLEDAIINRREINDYYKTLLEGSPVCFQKQMNSKHNYSYFPVLFENKGKRDVIFNKLIENGVKTRKYFYPLASDSVFLKQEKNIEDSIPVARSVSDRVLCLPIYPGLELSIVKKIVSIIKQNI